MKFEPPLNARMSRWTLLALVLFGHLWVVGCAGPMSAPSALMVKAARPASAPPADKTLVCIHRPWKKQQPALYEALIGMAWASDTDPVDEKGHTRYTSIWDGGHLIADLGNGNSAAYVCDPGTRYFINQSSLGNGVVEANLLPGQTYDLWVNVDSGFLFVRPSILLEPVKSDSKERALIPKWERKNHWVERGPAAAGEEQLRHVKIDLILHEYISGDHTNRLLHLATWDHR